ncbi:MAG TPA: NAD(P)-binding domain-containing protein, partial [Rugosimonospora sp.]
MGRLRRIGAYWASTGTHLRGLDQIMSASPRVKTVGIIGAGRVGSVLGAALAGAGYDVIGASGRSPAAQAHIEDLLPGTPRRRPTDIVAEADLVIFAVPDDALAPLVAHLAESGAFRRADAPDGQPTGQAHSQATGQAHSQPTGQADDPATGQAQSQATGQSHGQPAGEPHRGPAG